MAQTRPSKNSSDGAPKTTSRDDTSPISFLDENWSWSSPSTWPLSVKFLPFPVAFIALFFGVYIQHFLYGLTELETCIRDFDYGIPTSKIETLAMDLATHDWEQGAAAEALLELHNPELSIFGQEPFPKHQVPNTGVLKSKAIQYILPKIQLQQATLSNNTWGVSDPASLGVFAIMAAAELEKSDPLTLYKYAAQNQANYLLREAPRYANGAISHRAEVAELWSDAMFMFPPFLAYFASTRAGEGTIGMKQAVEQISLYRDVLTITEGPAKGAWKHIVGPSDMADESPWSTGNGWVLYGMARVRATLAGWVPGRSLMRGQIADLDRWMREIIDAAMLTDDHESGLLRNYLSDDSWFGDTAGTALIAAATYRYATFLEPGVERQRYIRWARNKMTSVFGHVNREGLAEPAVNSLKHSQREPLDGPNPEGQSFLLLLASAWRDCVCAGVCERTTSNAPLGQPPH